MNETNKQKPDRVQALLKYSRLFNPKDDETAGANGFAFNKLSSGERDYRLGVLLYAGVLTLREIVRRLDDLDTTGLDIRDELRDLRAMFEQAKPGRAEAGDEDDQADDDQAEEDDEDQADEDQADEDDDAEPPA